MTDLPWQGDACSLVDAFRRGEHSPVDELRASLAAIAASSLNAFSHMAADEALASAKTVDVGLPFGGVPIGIKELQDVRGWPATEASFPLKDHVADHDATMVSRIRTAGFVPFAMTTASEFGGVNLTRTVLNGATHNPWQQGTTPGGSSGGSAAAVAGGLVTLATAGDGGGSTRIPAGFCGLVGLKGTYGRIPRGPRAEFGNMTAVSGCVSRSVRDSARYLDVTNGFDSRDPSSLVKVSGYEANLGSYGAELQGKRVALMVDFGGAHIVPAVADAVFTLAQELIGALSLQQVTVEAKLPNMGTAWSLSGLLGIRASLADAWPACEGDLTPEMRYGLRWADGKWNAEASNRVAARRMEHNEAMATMFDQADLVMTATNPGVAFAADGPLPSVFGGKEVGGWNNGRLTAPSNLYGNPAISIPAGLVDGLPVGLQVLAPHFREDWLLHIALTAERLHPWPLVAPASPR